MCRDSTKPLRSTTASSTADSTVKVACEFRGMQQVYGARRGYPGYSTVTISDCQPEAPSGTGSARLSVWTSPVPSVARALM